MPVFSSYSSSIRLLPILHTGVRTIFRIQFGGGDGFGLLFHGLLECVMVDDQGDCDLLIPGHAGESCQLVDYMVAQPFIFLVRYAFPLLVLRGTDCILVLDGDFDDVGLFPPWTLCIQACRWLEHEPWV